MDLSDNITHLIMKITRYYSRMWRWKKAFSLKQVTFAIVAEYLTDLSDIMINFCRLCTRLFSWQNNACVSPWKHKLNIALFVIYDNTNLSTIIKLIIVWLMIRHLIMIRQFSNQLMVTSARLTLCLLVSSADNLWKQFGPRPSPTRRRTSGLIWIQSVWLSYGISKLIDSEKIIKLPW